MRMKIAAALAALAFATTANAANIYGACYYQDDVGVYPITQLFTLEGDAVGDSYPNHKYDGIKEWESQFATKPDEVFYVGSYTTRNIVGQFKAFAEEWDSHSQCFVSTSKDHALAHFAKLVSGRKVDQSRIQDWRPKNAGVLAVEDWSGRPSATPVETAEPKRETESGRPREEATTPPPRPKMTNAEADAKYAAEMAEYRRKLEAQQKQVADFKQAQDDVARRKLEQKRAAERAAADYQRQLAAHADTVRNQQLDYQKQVAKPYEAPNAVYRGFWGPDCDAARRSATTGAGTSSTTRFKEVTTETAIGGCTVQGWWWNVAGGGTATRQ